MIGNNGNEFPSLIRGILKSVVGDTIGLPLLSLMLHRGLAAQLSGPNMLRNALSGDNLKADMDDATATALCTALMEGLRELELARPHDHDKAGLAPATATATASPPARPARSGFREWLAVDEGDPLISLNLLLASMPAHEFAVAQSAHAPVYSYEIRLTDKQSPKLGNCHGTSVPSRTITYRQPPPCSPCSFSLPPPSSSFLIRLHPHPHPATCILILLLVLPPTLGIDLGLMFRLDRDDYTDEERAFVARGFFGRDGPDYGPELDGIVDGMRDSLVRFCQGGDPGHFVCGGAGGGDSGTQAQEGVAEPVPWVGTGGGGAGGGGAGGAGRMVISSPRPYVEEHVPVGEGEGEVWTREYAVWRKVFRERALQK